MYLSFDHKRKIFKSFPELTEEIKSNGRVNYVFVNSNQQRKVLARELTYTGNGYVSGQYLANCEYVVDDRGWINIRDFNEKQLVDLIMRGVESGK